MRCVKELIEWRANRSRPWRMSRLMEKERWIGWTHHVTFSAIQSEKTVKLLQGEILGWWSSWEFDQRVRMGAFVMGAVNDERNKILLEIGANISAISESFAG